MSTRSSLADLRRDLLDILAHGLARASVAEFVTRAMASPPPAIAGARGPLRLLAVGKAARPMAGTFRAWAGSRLAGGLVIGPPSGAPETPGLDTPGLETIEASHPAPDARSERAARRALAVARAAAQAGETLVVLLSGGASSLMALAAPGLTLADKAETSLALMHAGAAIDELNAVRKHLSAVKGGRLAAAAGATVTLAVSDVVAPVADDPCVIGSGPTVADPTTFADALGAIDRFGLRARIPGAAVTLLRRGARGEIEETVKPGDPRLARAAYHVIGSRLDALAGARGRAQEMGYTVVEIAGPLVGDAREAGAWLAGRAAEAAGAAPRVCVLAAGETTVRVHGRGKGGRNQELALAAALEGLGPREWALGSAGTDGVDGPTDAAGAVVDPTTLARAAAAGLDPRRFLDDNDVYRFFEPLGDLIKTGPTGTNVGDLQVVLIG